MSQPPMDTRLDHLETDVLARIADYRRAGSSAGVYPVGAIVMVCALLAGIAIGLQRSQPAPASGSEAAVLADDARLAPSALLAGNP
jgi:hypothetical protein